METIGTVTSWLNTNAGMMQAVFAGVVALFTGVYVWYTHRMWSEMRRTNDRMERPNVEALFEPNAVAFHFYDIVVRNAGLVPVHDVQLKLSANQIQTLDKEPLDQLPIFKQAIPVLLEGREHRSLAFSLLHNAQEPAKSTPVKLSVTYATPKGMRCEQAFEFDPKVARARAGFRQETIHDIGRHIKTISETLQKVVETVRRVEGSIDYTNYLLPRQVERPAAPDIALRVFERIWKDFKRADFSELGVFRMRSQCHATYDSLCGVHQCSEELDQMRRTLLAMLGHHYQYMDPKVGDCEFVKLGDSVMAMIAWFLSGGSKHG